jgi:hypothetical protein
MPLLSVLDGSSRNKKLYSGRRLVLTVGLTEEEFWGGGDGGTDPQVVAEQPTESLTHARSQANARTARHRRPHEQTWTTATIRGVTWSRY